MKKLFLLLFVFLMMVPIAKSELSTSDVNLFNVKEKSVYMLTFPSKVYEYNIVNEKSINVTPMTSISNDKRMLVVEARNSGVSDVAIRTEDSLYQIRFVIGPEFEDVSDDLIMIDLPSVLIGGN